MVTITTEVLLGEALGSPTAERMMNQTIHAIDLLVWLMNCKPVEAVSMISQRRAKIEAEDLGMAVLKMDNGALAAIEGTTCTSDKDKCAEFTVFCENGT